MKELIFFPKNKLKPKGGPSGYLFNLYQEVSYGNYNNIDIQFLENSNTYTDNKALKNIIPNRIRDIRRFFSFMGLLHKKNTKPNNINEFDLIHFHSTEDLYLSRNWINDYDGKVVLTSHSPCAYHKELISRLNPIDAKLFRKSLQKLEIIDEYAFQRADYIIFPCIEAEEPYFHTWDKYQKIRDSKKYLYVPTGIVGCKAKKTKNEIRNQYGIPIDAFVVSYVGRHNEIKGYSDLKIIGEKLIGSNDNIWFLIAGKEEPLTGINNKNWVEVGWTKDPHSIIAASDVFILPNRETYFDLILLEVMSLGKPVILSRTGGNKYFSRFDSKGLMFYSTIDECVECVKRIQNFGQHNLEEIGNENRFIFEKYFTSKVFSINYINTVKKIVGEGNE